MKISAAPYSFAETAQQASSVKDRAGYGDVFESAIRGAEKDSTGKLPARDGDAASAEIDEEGAPSTAVRPGRIKSGDEGKDGSTLDKEKLEEGTENDAAEAGQSPALALLGRLLGAVAAGGANAAASAAASAEPTPAEGEEIVLHERTVVVSLQPGATEEALDGSTRGKVTLEVLRMETHFEPRSDAVVLVEAKAEAEAAASSKFAAEPMPGTKAEGGAVPKSPTSADAPTASAAGNRKIRDAAEATSKVRLSFDEALARLGKQAAIAASDEDADAGKTADASLLDARAAASADESVVDGAAKAGKGRDDGRSEDRGASRSRSGEERVSSRIAPQVSSRIDDGATGSLPLGSMTDQVAGRIIDTLGASTSASRGAERPAGESVLRFTAGGAALKTLTIQLQPENLGVLDVSMRLVDGQLTLELAASEASTAKILAEDREGLRKLLQHAGFSMDEASITIVTRDSSADMRIDASNGTSASRQDGGSSAGGGFGGGAGTGANEREARRSDGDGQDRSEGRARGGDREAPRGREKSASTYI